MMAKGFCRNAGMDWDDLRVFLAVARAESLTGAGRVLKVDTATVGRRIARLEAAIGVALFGKSPQGYILTDAGHRLIPQAEAMETAALLAADRPAGLAGQVRVGAPDGAANYLLPQVATAIMAANPGLEVQIVALPRVFNLTRREADMAVAVSRPAGGRVTAQKITDYHLSVAASRDYLARAGTPATKAALRDHPVVGYIPDLIFDKELDYLGELGVARVGAASNSVSVQLNWLRAGAGVGVVHDFALPFAPELVRVLPEVRLIRAFWLIRHEGDGRLDRLTRFARVLADGIRAEVARLEAVD
jgi:DNA-binding transcriptional LysR family regulator